MIIPATQDEDGEAQDGHQKTGQVVPKSHLQKFPHISGPYSARYTSNAVEILQTGPVCKNRRGAGRGSRMFSRPISTRSQPR